jgi:hypothetical protein
VEITGRYQTAAIDNQNMIAAIAKVELQRVATCASRDFATFDRQSFNSGYALILWDTNM